MIKVKRGNMLVGPGANYLSQSVLINSKQRTY